MVKTWDSLFRDMKHNSNNNNNNNNAPVEGGLVSFEKEI